MANAVVNSYKVDQFEANVDFLSDTIRMMYLDNNHTTNIDTQQFIDDVSANEVVGTGYVAEGPELGSKTVTQDNTNDRGVADAADITLSGSTITVRYGVLYKDTGTPGTSPIMGIYDFVSDKSSSASDFTFQASADGYIYNQ
jgi:hypothetical protein